MRFSLHTSCLLVAIGVGVYAAGQQTSPLSGMARTRWIEDLKKFGYDNFERAKSDKLWKQQQGIAFLGPDKVIVYQVQRAAFAKGEESTARFTMQADI